MEDDQLIFLKNQNKHLKKNGGWPQINLIGCDTIVNSPSLSVRASHKIWNKIKVFSYIEKYLTLPDFVVVAKSVLIMITMPK